LSSVIVHYPLLSIIPHYLTLIYPCLSLMIDPVTQEFIIIIYQLLSIIIYFHLFSSIIAVWNNFFFFHRQSEWTVPGAQRHQRRAARRLGRRGRGSAAGVQGQHAAGAEAVPSEAAGSLEISTKDGGWLEFLLGYGHVFLGVEDIWRTSEMSIFVKLPNQNAHAHCQKSEFLNKLLLRLRDLLVLKLVLECFILIKGLTPFFCLVGWTTIPKTMFFLIRF